MRYGIRSRLLQCWHGPITSENVAKPGTSGMVAKFLNWLRHTVTDLSEKTVDDAVDSDTSKTIDFEILGDPRHPQFHEMRRRHNEQQAREDRDGGE